MYRYDTYSVHAAEAPMLRRWMLVTFVLSVALHGALFVYLNSTYVRGLVLNEENLKVTKPMNLKRVTIPDLPADQPAPQPQKAVPKLNPLVLPADKPTLEGEVQMAPQIAELGKAAFTDKPKLDSRVADRLRKTEARERQPVV